jgi:CheY-like chemotaxis protein/signal transduction histidine kinase
MPNSDTESPIINYWTLQFKNEDIERECELANLRNRKSIINTVLYCITPFYMLSMYWANILLSTSHHSVTVPLSIVCLLTYFICTSAAIAVLFAFDEEVVVYNSFCRWIFVASAWALLLNFGVLFYFQGYYDLCHPTHFFNGVCSRGQYPADMLLSTLAVYPLVLLGFPSFSWTAGMVTHLLAILVSCACTSLYESSLKVPLMIWSSVFLTVTIMVRRRDTITRYLHFKNFQTKKDLEQHAKIGDRLRLMISGVAHDLKSPLSALSLGLESISVIHDKIRTIVYDVPLKSEQISRTEELLFTIKDLGQWLDNSRRAMTTIISRCVDVNQALNGVPLVPMIRDIEVTQTVNSIVQHYSEDNQHVQLISRIDNSILQTVHGHLQTDALWFRESLGCLLSNAIKFCDYSDTTCLREGTKHYINIYVSRILEESDWGQRLSKNNSITRSSRHVASGAKDSVVPSVLNLEDCFLRVEVWDEGVGVDKELEKSLFSFLGHSNQVRVGGAGLGLGALACRIRTLGGRYGYQSRLQRDNRRGSIFWFEVPYKPLVLSRSIVDTIEKDSGPDGKMEETPLFDVESQSPTQNQISLVSQESLISNSANTSAPGIGLVLNTSSKDSVLESVASSKGTKSKPIRLESKRGNSVGNLEKTGGSNSTNQLALNHPEAAATLRKDVSVDRLTEEVRLQLMGEVKPSANVAKSIKQPPSQHRGHRYAGAVPTMRMRSIKDHSNHSSPDGLERKEISAKATQHGHHAYQFSAMANSRVVPVDDDYSPYEAKLERRGSQSSLASGKENTSDKQSVPSSGSKKIPTETRGSTVSRIIENMPMVAESSPEVLDTRRASHHKPVLPTDSSFPPNTPDRLQTGYSLSSPRIGNNSPASHVPSSSRDTGSVVGSMSITPKRILIVDDSMPIRKMCSMILKQHGHSVQTAMNGKEALQMMAQAYDAIIAASQSAETTDLSKQIDLVLMDIQMPVMDGIEAVTLYRAYETQQLQKLQYESKPEESMRLPQRMLIIGMSACSDIDIIEKGLSIGMDRFVAKPFQIQHLTPIIHEHFHNQQFDL